MKKQENAVTPFVVACDVLVGAPAAVGLATRALRGAAIILSLSCSLKSVMFVASTTHNICHSQSPVILRDIKDQPNVDSEVLAMAK